MINSESELKGFIFDVIQTITSLDDKYIIYANQVVDYPKKQSFVVIDYSIENSPLASVVAENGAVINKITITCNVFGSRFLADRIFNAKQLFDFTDSAIVSIESGENPVNRTELEAGGYLQRFDTSLILHLSINHSIADRAIGQELGEINIENQ